MKDITDIDTYTHIDRLVDLDTGKGTRKGIRVYLTMRTCFF